MNKYDRQRMSGGLPENEVEALQTDVMRFIAILGICLMVIFALVQSLPVSSQGNRPKVYDKEILQRQVDNLSRQLAAQQKDLQAVTQAIKERKKTLAHYQKELSLAHSKYLRAKRQLDAAENKLKIEHAKIKGIVENVDEARKYAESLKGVLDGLWKKVAQEKVKKKHGPNVYKKSYHAYSSQKGFALRFASESALEQLVGRNKVRFYMISGGKSWRLSEYDGGRWRFNPVQRADMPKQVYQLVGDRDVPESFVSAGKEVVADFRGPEYYVWLPPDIRKEISKIMAERNSGEIEIGNLGDVSVQ